MDGQQIKKSGINEASAAFGQRDHEQTKENKMQHLQVTHRLTHAQVSVEQQLFDCDMSPSAQS